MEQAPNTTKPEALTKEVLDGLPCGCCGIPNLVSGDELVLLSHCHPEVHPKVTYLQGILTLTCPVCEGPVCSIKVEANPLDANFVDNPN